MTRPDMYCWRSWNIDAALFVRCEVDTEMNGKVVTIKLDSELQVRILIEHRVRAEVCKTVHDLFLNLV